MQKAWLGWSAWANLEQEGECCSFLIPWQQERAVGTIPVANCPFSLAASYTSNLAYSFYSHKLYAEACAVSEPFCQYLGLAKPSTYPEVSPEKV